ncbi:DUF2059 domain-containing protein [Erythrobacter sp.]|jgi:hypothetical protein|uniref:DUF2059 domain-containing protein n=1 Tax=Erythrobacter sp. TaxID=1042 RepID=UPI002EBF7D75|nr:DUF2059 domain-containing protein [Erythrobacter sp.]
MIKRTVLAGAAAAGLLAASPVSAQADQDMDGDHTADPAQAAMGEVMGALSGLFQAEPLSAEEEARLPAATALVTTMMPAGFYAEMMTEMMDGMLGPMMGMMSGETGASLVIGTRLAGSEIDMDALSAEEKLELATLLDPAFAERGSAMQTILRDIMSEAAVIVEPLFRDGLAKAYAVRFDTGQLADIATFFATPTGQVYAQENMKLMADPQVMSASMQALPAMLGQLGNMEGRMIEIMADLPAEKSYVDLTAAERARISELTGIASGELEDAILPPADELEDMSTFEG